MANTTFTGPIRAGNVLNTTGTAAGSVANVGQVTMAQTAAITQSATAAATAICIPAGSQIVRITQTLTAGFTNSATISIGTSSTSTELVSGGTASAVGVSSLTPGTDATRTGNWVDVGTSDVIIYVKASAAPVSTTGAGFITVEYLQARDLTP